MRHLFLLFTFVFLFTHCKNEDATKSNKKVFHYNQQNPITSLDPAFAKNQAIMWAVEHMYNGFVYLDDSLNIIPCLAKRFEISKDGLDYTFHLHDNVLFHDNACFNDGKGRKMVASPLELRFMFYFP